MRRFYLAPQPPNPLPPDQCFGFALSFQCGAKIHGVLSAHKIIIHNHHRRLTLNPNAMAAATRPTLPPAVWRHPKSYAHRKHRRWHSPPPTGRLINQSRRWQTAAIFCPKQVRATGLLKRCSAISSVLGDSGGS